MSDLPSTAGARHVNAALGLLRAGRIVDPYADRCMTAARKVLGSRAVTAAHDLMVVSVERRG
jgi:hypothetical protein